MNVEIAAEDNEETVSQISKLANTYDIVLLEGNGRLFEPMIFCQRKN